MPASRMRAIFSTRYSRSLVFMPAAGSSSMSSLGSDATARAISTSLWMP